MSTLLLEAGSEAAARGSENCLPVGTRVAEFEITGIVGEGGFGIVYLAFDHSLQRVVALKEYMPGVMAGRGGNQSVLVRSKRHQEAFDTGLRSFINEARLLAQFDHPALIKIHRFWEQNNTGYMAMRYYEGQTLKRIVEDNPGFVTQDWLKVMLQSILEALEALYRVQILHRDISPENIMIQTNGEAVLLDFGAARQIISDMTQALTVILKPGYAPIEQYADDPSMLQGPWTDIYSLSAVMYVAITNRTPPSSVARMIQDPLQPLADGNHPGYSQNLLRAIDRGLAVRPEDRPRSIPEFRALLGLETQPVGAESLPRQTAASPVRGGRSMSDAITSVWPAIPGGSLAGASAPDALTRPMTAAPRRPPVAAVHVPRATPAAAKAPSASRRMMWIGLACALVVAAVALYRLGGYASAPAPAPESPQRATSAAPAEQVVDEETLAWETLRQHADPDIALVSGFIAKYPNGKMTDQARQRLAELKKSEAEAAAKTAATPAAPTVPVAAPAVSASVEVKPAETANGAVVVSVKPWGTVTIDGIDKGVSPPLKRLTLGEGRHAVKVSNPGFPDYVTEIDVSRKVPAQLKVNFAPGAR